MIQLSYWPIACALKPYLPSSTNTREATLHCLHGHGLCSTRECTQWAKQHVHARCLSVDVASW